jgi:predicted AAA+ superfamily ATPase
MIKRVQEKRLLELLDRFPVVAVIGPRQVGKSTLVRCDSVNSGRSYFTLDDFDTLGLAGKDPKTLLSAGQAVTIDEVQRSPELLRFIKAEVDKDRRPGRFLITGSSDLNLTANLAHELTGRVGILPLRPLSWRELEERLTPPVWLSWLDAGSIADMEVSCKLATPKVSDIEASFSGGYPLAVTAPTVAARRDWFASYRFTYLERDVRQISNIGNLSDFARFFQMVAGRTTQLLNTASLARDVGVNATTSGRYLSLLEASFQILRLTPWFSNMGKRLVKSPKIYWSDTGLLTHLLGLESWADASSQGFNGALMETFAIMEICKQVEMSDPSMRLHFVRSHDGLEVDGLVVRGLKQLPFEIKASSTIRVEDGVNLERYMTLSGSASVGVVFYRGTEYRRLSRRVMAVPLTALLM